MKKENINKILGETEAGYDRMAEKFSGTRSFFWPDLEFIKDHIAQGEKIFDFGCGNGRLLEILKDKNIEYYGADASQNLIDLAKQKYPQFSQNFSKISGQASLPFPDEFFNKIVSIAVFHHFPDKKFRLDMAKELYRITRPEGEIIITVWNLWPASLRRAASASRGGQKKYYKYIIKNWLSKLTGKSDLAWNDCYIPFKNNAGETFKRFHHAYTKKELTKLFSQAGFKATEVKNIKNKNLVLIAKKI